MSNGPTSFPVLAFGPGMDGDPDVENVSAYFDEHHLFTGDKVQLERRNRVGLLLVDETLSTWRIVKMSKIGPYGGFWERLLNLILLSPYYDFRLEFVEETPLSLDEIKTRVCDSVQAEGYLWADDELVAGEAGEPRDEQELLDEKKQRVRDARTLTEVIDGLYYKE